MGHQDHKQLMNISVKILLDYINKENSDISKKWSIYAMIRKVSYLLLDSTYAPIPFNLELPTIISNLEELFDNQDKNNNLLEETINKINSLLQDSLYMSANSMITTTEMSQELKVRFNEIQEESDSEYNFKKISNIKRLLRPLNKNNADPINFFNDYKTYDFPENNWFSESSFNLNYLNSEFYPNLFPVDLVSWEEKTQNYCGKTSCIVSASKNPNDNIFRIAFSIRDKSSYYKNLKAVLKFNSKIITFNNNLRSEDYSEGVLSDNELILAAQSLNFVFDSKYKFVLKSPDLINTPVRPIFVGYGTGKVVNSLNSYIKKAEKSLNDDEVKELESLKLALKKLDYQGYIIAFGGSTQVYGSGSDEREAEFDGIILLPNCFQEQFLFIVESKNTSSGNTEAKNQLALRLGEIIDDDKLRYSINKLGNRAAISHISLI